MSERTPEPGWYFDKDGWSQRLPISDEECLLICLNNAPQGTDQKQIARLIRQLELGG